MKNKLKRYYGRNDLHFITFSCYQRKTLLDSVHARNTFVKILTEVRESSVGRRGFGITTLTTTQPIERTRQQS